MEKSLKKRWIISFAYIAFFLVIVFFFYSTFKAKETCFDGLKNQNEGDVDCGGVCFKKCKKIETQELLSGEVGIISSSVPGEYDFFGVITNPNGIYGSEYFDYKIEFEDGFGALLGSKTGNNFILPGEKKYIIENNVTLSGVPVRAMLSISNVRWTEFQDYYEKPDIKIINKSYNEISSGVGFSEAKGLLKNESPHDFSAIKIKVILKDEVGRIIALNSTQLNTVRSGENRDFRALWPGRFSGVVANVETQVEINIFNSDSFAKKYVKEQQFQDYSR